MSLALPSSSLHQLLISSMNSSRCFRSSGKGVCPEHVSMPPKRDSWKYTTSNTKALRGSGQSLAVCFHPFFREKWENEVSRHAPKLYEDFFRNTRILNSQQNSQSFSKNILGTLR